MEFFVQFDKSRDRPIDARSRGRMNRRHLRVEPALFAADRKMSAESE
jgi:hypothetical protein